MLIALNKPYGTVCQFTSALDKSTLGQWLDIPDVYPAGRLDSDSEGLVLLTDQGWLQAAIAHPAKKLAKRYWVQVEGHANARACAMIKAGIDLGAFRTRPAHARPMAEPAQLWPRVPPIRVRAQIPTSWLEVTLTEGKNRQLRRMTAATGYPALRLVRVGIGALDLFALDLAPGQWRRVDEKDLGIAQNELVPRAKNAANLNTSTGVRSRSRH